MGKHKRFLSGLLCAAMLVSLLMSTGPALAADAALTSTSGHSFTDVDADEWYAQAVAFCWERDLMLGISSTSFDPNGTMTRGMLATVLYRLAGEPEVTSSSPFLDVSEDSWYGPAIIWAVENEIIVGYANGYCGPDDFVTREQMVTILWRYAGKSEPTGTALDFADESAIASWAATAVDWARENGVVSGTDKNLFLPQNTAQRCEIATVLMNYVLFLESSGTQPAEGVWKDFLDLFGYLPEKTSVPSNSYISSGFVAQKQANGSYYMTYAYSDYAVGVDVSYYQGTIDWQQVADSGIEFAIIRVGYRGYTKGSLNTDTCFVKNIEGALAAGLKVGVYFFSQAVTVQEAVEEAEYVLEKIKGYDITYPVVFDWERQSYSDSRTKDTSEETVAACAVAFCETIKAAGYTPMFYASPTMAYAMEMGYLAQYPFWLANYTNLAPTSYTYHFDMWQYTSTGTVPGISGSVDMNICLRTDW